MRPVRSHSKQAGRTPPLRARRSPMHSPVQAHFESWSLPVPVTLALLLAAFVYAQGWFRLRKAFPHATSVWQFGAFMSGLFSLWIALGSPLAAFDHYLLSIHMVEHV